MPADKSEDLKAKFKQALDKKQGNDAGATPKGHGREPKSQHPHGPDSVKRGFIRRKTG
jgi:Family of unknown function (DUF5302)